MPTFAQEFAQMQQNFGKYTGAGGASLFQADHDRAQNTIARQVSQPANGYFGHIPAEMLWPAGGGFWTQPDPRQNGTIFGFNSGGGGGQAGGLSPNVADWIAPQLPGNVFQQQTTAQQPQMQQQPATIVAGSSQPSNINVVMPPNTQASNEAMIAALAAQKAQMLGKGQQPMLNFNLNQPMRLF